MDSADVWAHPELFALDAEGRPVDVAGVPPDYFSETGQLWGNPLYDWDRMERDGYAWWIERIRANLRSATCCASTTSARSPRTGRCRRPTTTALNGTWVPGPGRRLFDAARRALGRRCRSSRRTSA